MINPNALSVTSEIIGLALPAFGIGAAIFRIRKLVGAEPIVETLQQGRGHALAVTESDDDDFYVGVPTGGKVNMEIDPNGNRIVAKDMRKNAELKVFHGRADGAVGLVDNIGDMEIHDVEKEQSVDVRYLGPVHKSVLRESLEKLFEQGIE